MNTMTSPKCNLLESDEDYFASKPSSYYKRANLLSNTSISFREKCKRSFTSRSSSYTFLQDEKEQLNDLSPYEKKSNSLSFFSRKKPTSPFDEHHLQEEDEEDDSDENTFFAGNKKYNKSYARQDFTKRSSSWTSNMLKAVGVKSK